MARKSNYPSTALNNVEPDVVSEVIGSLKQLHDMGRCQSDLEVSDRIDAYFRFCQQSGLRCGVESLCLSLSISRTTFWNWCSGIDCSQERQQICLSAKQFIASYLEQISLQGKLNPATSCFLFKNWLGYKDAAEPVQTTATPILTTDSLPTLSTKASAELPIIDVDARADG